MKSFACISFAVAVTCDQSAQFSSGMSSVQETATRHLYGFGRQLTDTEESAAPTRHLYGFGRQLTETEESAAPTRHLYGFGRQLFSPCAVC